MSRTIRLTVLSLLIATFGCAQATTPDPIGGETHFLESCEGDTCGLGLDCVCGVCTKPCLTDNTCKDLSANATCEGAGTPIAACASPEASPVCDVTCTGDSDCKALGFGYTCASGSCRKLTTGSCTRDGVIYPNGKVIDVGCNTCTCADGAFLCTRLACIDAGIEGGIDSSVGGNMEAGVDATVTEEVIVEPACVPSDGDAGTPNLEVIPTRPLTCAAVTAAMALPGATVVGWSWDVVEIELSQDDVYWASYGEPYFLQASKLGGTTLGAVGLGSGASSTKGLIYSGCRLYWGSDLLASEISIGSWTVDGADMRTLSRRPYTNVYSLLADLTHLYFATTSGADATDIVMRVPRGGGSTIELARRPAQHVSSLVDTIDRIYWAEVDDDRTLANDSVQSMPKDRSSGPTPVVGNLGNPSSMLREGPYLYVLNGGTWDSLNNHRADGSVIRIEIATGDVTVLASGITSPTLGYSGTLTADATQLYWFMGATNALDLMRLSKDGSTPPSIVFDNLRGVADDLLAVDEVNFYFGIECPTDGAYLMRVPKP